jgi:hypothetical protein
VYIIHFYESGFTTLIRFNYWILCETVLPGQGDVPRLAEVDFTDTDTVAFFSQSFLIFYEFIMMPMSMIIFGRY